MTITATKTATLETIEEILLPGQHGRAGELNRRLLVEYLGTVDLTIDTPNTSQVFLDFVGDHRVAVVYCKYSRTVLVHWFQTLKNFEVTCEVWEYSLDRPQGFLNKVLSY